MSTTKWKHAKMMKVIETGIQIDGRDLRLNPVAVKGEILLYDMYLGEVLLENWRGSRRTVSACGMFLGMPDLMERLWG